MRIRKNEERNTESLSVRLKPSIKALVKKSAEIENMTISEFVEVMILDYCSIPEEEKQQVN